MKQILINNLEFAKKQETIEGDINAKFCERLAETLFLSDKQVTNITYKLVGHAQKQQAPTLNLTVKTILPVLCQRCLEEMKVDLSLIFDYLITNTEPGDSDEIDWLEPMLEMNVKDIIEDELLMAMPIAPTHETQCTKVALVAAGGEVNPFAKLKGRFK